VAMTEHAVVIAGGGPTGLMLAGELALAAVDVAIVERRASQDLIGSRAGGLHSRTIEVLDQRGIADRFLSEGQPAQVAAFAGTTLDISDLPTRHPYVLGLWQNHIERILAGWVDELEVPIYRERDVTGFAQNDTGVDVDMSGGQSLRAEYLVGCDGGRSAIRKAAGIEFPGWDATTSSLIAQVELAEEPELGIRRDALGVHAFGRLEYEIRDGEVVYAATGPVGVMVTEEHVGSTSEPTLRDLSEALIAVYGTDYGIHSPTGISRFTDMTRQAASYRDRRVLLAGDARTCIHRWVDSRCCCLAHAVSLGRAPLLVEIPGTDRRGDVLRVFTIGRAVLEFDYRIELLARELPQSDALARPQRPLHDLVVDPFVVQRFLHAPARAGLPRRRAPVELDRHAGDDSQPRSSPANPKARRTRHCSSRPPPPRGATRPRPSAQTGVGGRGCEARSSSTSASTSWRRPGAASVPARAARG